MPNPFAVCESIREVVGQCAGAVSMCWDPRPTGVFDSQPASEFVDSAVARINQLVGGGFPVEDYKPGGKYYRTFEKHRTLGHPEPGER